MMRPFLERLVGGMTLVIFGPALLVIALLLYVTGGSPVVVFEEQPNSDGTMARPLRFRTTGQGAPFFRQMGRWLRAFSFDVLPGFWNVACGEITLRNLLVLLRRK